MGLLTEFSSKAELHRRETAKGFDEFILSYLAEIEASMCPRSEALKITLVARSAGSQVAQAVARHIDRFTVLGIELQVIFANIDPSPILADFVEMTGLLNGQNRLYSTIRWAKIPALIDAHEQLVLGTSHCWTGDAMSRSPDIRYSLELFDRKGGRSVQNGLMGFASLWSLCATIPKFRLRSLSSLRDDEPVVVELDGFGDQFLQDVIAGEMMTRH